MKLIAVPHLKNSEYNTTQRTHCCLTFFSISAYHILEKTQGIISVFWSTRFSSYKDVCNKGKDQKLQNYWS